MILTRFFALVALGFLIASDAGARDRAVLVAPGVVEPISEEREVALEVIGRVERVLVEENDAVSAGQALVQINAAEFEANLGLARANLAIREAELERLVNGARVEERRELAALVQQFRADRDFLETELKRQDPLAAKGVASRARLDQARSQFDAAEARLRAATERLTMIEAPARQDEVRAAEARVKAAAAQVDLAKTQLDKTTVRSPIAGTVLRLERRNGEVVSNQPPTLIAVLGDLSRLRVRMEVDELDVGRIAVGQNVRVVANAYPGKPFLGRVTRVNHRMGRKQIFTGRAAERLDNRALQVLVELEPGARLPVGLMVDVFVLEAAGR